MAVRNPLSKLFGPSPIRPIQEHMTKAHDAAEALLPFLQAANQGDWKAAREQQQIIVRREREADKLKKFVRLHLPKSLLLPVPRSDLLELVGMQDQIANYSKDIAELIVGRQMRFPEHLGEMILSYANAAVATTTQAMKATNELDELFESGFSGTEIKVIEQLINELDRLEKQTDKIRPKVKARLFKLESQLPPVEVMFLYRIIDWIGDLAEHSEKVGHRLQLLIAR